MISHLIKKNQMSQWRIKKPITLNAWPSLTLKHWHVKILTVALTTFVLCHKIFLLSHLTYEPRFF